MWPKSKLSSMTPILMHSAALVHHNLYPSHQARKAAAINLPNLNLVGGRHQNSQVASSHQTQSVKQSNEHLHLMIEEKKYATASQSVKKEYHQSQSAAAVELNMVRGL